MRMFTILFVPFRVQRASMGVLKKIKASLTLLDKGGELVSCHSVLDTESMIIETDSRLPPGQCLDIGTHALACPLGHQDMRRFDTRQQLYKGLEYPTTNRVFI
jgi:hypothetical protein